MAAIAFTLSAILALIALVSTGCTTRSWYEGLQSSAALECNRRPGSDREACLSQLNKLPYDQYERGRKPAKD